MENSHKEPVEIDNFRILRIWEIHAASQPGQAERLHEFPKSGGYQTMYDFRLAYRLEVSTIYIHHLMHIAPAQDVRPLLLSVRSIPLPFPLFMGRFDGPREVGSDFGS